MKTFTFRISEPLFEQLESHLFPGDGDEHGAVITAGICVSDRETRFLAREIILARDGIDYVPGKHGYRALTADFVARASHHCARENLCYFAVHCHGGGDFVDFSTTDTDSHRRGYTLTVNLDPLPGMSGNFQGGKGARPHRRGLCQREEALALDGDGKKAAKNRGFDAGTHHPISCPVCRACLGQKQRVG